MMVELCFFIIIIIIIIIIVVVVVIMIIIVSCCLQSMNCYWKVHEQTLQNVQQPLSNNTNIIYLKVFHSIAKRVYYHDSKCKTQKRCQLIKTYQRQLHCRGNVIGFFHLSLF